MNTDRIAVSIGCVVLTAMSMPAADWPRYRGPNHDGKVWASSSHGAGSRLAALGAGTLTPIYENKVCCWLNCAVLWKEHLYFLSNADGGQTMGLRCVEFATGATKWVEKSIGGQSGLLMADGQLVILESGATVSGRDSNPHDLIVAEVSPPAGERSRA
jgi:hypothetical protein